MAFSVALLAVLWMPAAGQPHRQESFWPGANYDPSIPSFVKVLGYDAGERISSHADIVRYLEALAAAAPARVKVIEYAKSWQGRRLLYAVLGSEANLRRLAEIKAAMRRLADPRRTPPAEAAKIMAGLPAVVWLAYGVHGNEISSPNAALLTAYHLIASKGDRLVDDILARVVVLIDPLQNPDGRDRFVHNFESALGLQADASPLAAEHNEPWPGGRTNHYHFDLNRDWFALTQPETRGRVRAILEWLPLIFVDLHEMGSESTYYFAPEADPFNPHLSADLMESLVWVGKNNAKWFDQFGFSYFTREVYDNFYPGYGASWPCYLGSVAMTYEQASPRGLLMRRSDGEVLTFRDAVRRHFVASLSTLETAARYREKLVAKFYRFRQSAVEEGSKESIREYVFPRVGNVSAVDKLALLLAEQGIEVKRALAPLRVAGKDAPAGSYVVPTAQPMKRLVRVLLDRNVPMDEKFLAEQERRRARKLPDEIYDVTAWSLPLLFNVEVIANSTESTGNFEMVDPSKPPRGALHGGKAEVAYLVPWFTSGAARLAIAALRQGYRVWSSDKAFTQNGRRYPGGTLIFKVKENPDSLAGAVEKMAAEFGVDVQATNTGWVDDGVNFGSRYVAALRQPAVALAWDRPTAAGSAGHARFVLERQFGLPVTAIRTAQLASADLRRFDVVILPDSVPGDGYAAVLGGDVPRRLRDWVAGGGVLIAINAAVSYLADPKTGLLAISQESRHRATEPPKKKEAGESRAPGQLFSKPEDFEKAIQADSELPDRVAGVLAKARLDADHWITAGLGDSVFAMVNGRQIFTPIKLDKGVNPAIFAGPDELAASGYLWEENRKQLAFKPLLVVQQEGRGSIIAFTADPNFRGFNDGMNGLFLNAVLRGPARARPAP